MLEVIKFIKQYGIEKLKEDFSIDINEYNDRIVLNYNQFDSSNKFHQITRECRGLILSKPDLKILSRSFDRFFNYGEDNNSSNFNWKNAEIQEKLDGSLCIVYHDGIKWNVQTRKMAFAEGIVNYDKYKFDELFERTLGINLQDAFNDFGGHKEHSYIFELITPFNKVVKDYNGEFKLYLIGIRSKEDGYEWSLNEEKENYLKKYMNLPGILLPKVYHFNSIDEIQKSMNELPKDEEGYVALNKNIDGTSWRIKIKNPSYVALARLKDGMSNKRIIELIFERDYEELLIAFPEYKEIFKKYENAFQQLVADIFYKYHEVRMIEEQKEFALKIQNLPYCGVLFNMRKEYNHPIYYLNRLSINKKINLIEQYAKENS